MKAGEMNGWTCPDVSPNSGPCWKHTPAANICGRCGKPVDNHPLLKEPGKCEEVTA